MVQDEYLHSSLTDVIINAFYKVFNVLGYGFLEKVYENALKYELESRGLMVEAQKLISVSYQNKVVGNYTADLIVDGKVLIELKAAESLRIEHYHQLTNYLKATSIEVGLLVNFGKEPEVRRFCYTNAKKQLRRAKDTDISISYVEIVSKEDQLNQNNQSNQVSPLFR